MRAVILAAGRGSRLGHLGSDRPKCLVQLEGRPLIERQIAALRRGGADEIAVVRGYRAVFLDGHAPDLGSLWKLWLLSAVVFVLGYAWFHKLRRSFADII